MTGFVSENVCLQDKVPPSSTETDVSNPEPVKREISRSVSESDDGESEKGVEFDPDAIIQAAKPEHADMKPKLSGRKLVEMPMQRKGGELSSLCSIM